MDGMKGAPLSVLYLAAPICVHGPQARQGGTERSRGSSKASQHKEATLESSAADISKETLIRAMFPPREWTDPDGNTWLSFPSSELPTRDSALRAHEHLERELKRRQARPEPLDDVREEIFAELFDELIRYIALLNPERGLLLLRVRDERRLTLLSLSALAQGGSRFGTNSVVRIRYRGYRAMERAGLQYDRIGHANTAVLAALDSTAAPGTNSYAGGGEIVPLSSQTSEMSGYDAAGQLSSSSSRGTSKPDHRGRGVLPARAALVTRLWPHNDAITRAAAEAAAVERFGAEEASRLFELVRRAAATDLLEGTAAAAVAGSARAAGRSGSGDVDDDDLVVLETPGKPGIGARNSESERLEGVGLARDSESERLEGVGLARDSESERLEGVGLARNSESERLEGVGLARDSESERLEGVGLARDSESERLEGVGLAEGKDEEEHGGEWASTSAWSAAGAIASSLASALPVDPEEEELSKKVVAVQRDVDSLRARKAELEALMQAVGARARARRYAAVRVAEQAEAEAQDEAGIGMGTSSGGGILGGAAAGSSSKAPSALAAALRASDGGRHHHGARAGAGAGGEGAIMEQQLALYLQRRAQKARLESQIEALRAVLGRAAAAAAAAGDGDYYSDDGSDTGLDVATGLGPEPSLDSAVGLDH